MDFKIVTGTCSLSKSTHITCPCACACMQRLGMDLDLVEHVHHRWRVRFHPLFGQACKELNLDEYYDMTGDNNQNLCQPVSSSDSTHKEACSTDEVIRRANSDIFARLGDMSGLSQAERIT